MNRRGIKPGAFTDTHAKAFLKHMHDLPSTNKIKMFNAGITAERNLAAKVGDHLYEEKKRLWRSADSVSDQVKKEVRGVVRELTNDPKLRKAFLAKIKSDALKVGGRAAGSATSIANRTTRALVLYIIVNEVLEDGNIEAGEVSRTVGKQIPLIGDAVQGGMAMGQVYEYLEEEVDNPRTMQDWANSSEIYEGPKLHLRIRSHGISGY